VTRIGPLGEVGGIASGQISALAATLVGSGVECEVAATGIKNFTLALNAGDAATKKQRAAYKALGLDVAKVSQVMQKDPERAMITVLKQIGKLEKHQQAAMLTQLFGKESVAAIAPLLTNMEMLEENLKKVNNPDLYKNSMEKEFQARAATTENSLQLLKNSVSSLSIVIGNQLLPPLSTVMTWLASGINGIVALANKFPRVTKGLVSIVGGLGALKVGITVLRLAYVAARLPSQLLELALANQKAALVLNGQTSIWAAGKAKIHAAAERVRGLATKASATIQKSWNAAMRLGSKLLDAGKFVARRSAELALNAATKAGTLARTAWNTVMKLGHGLLDAGRLVFYHGKGKPLLVTGFLY
jgi:hypothetical protein